MLMNRKAGVAALLAALVLVLDPARTDAQSFSAQVAGRALDDSGAVLPGVTITATNEETGVQRSVVTADTGAYQLTGLEPGRYTITAELQGFAPVKQTALTLSVSQAVRLDLTMKVAGLEEAVTVTADTPLVSTTKSEIGLTVTPKQIDELPLNGRNFMELALLAPGVKVPLERASADISFGGSSGRSTTVQVDGADNNDDTVGGSETGFSMESIREFQVVTNRFAAEFGRTSAGVVNIVTRSGTNDLRGGLFGFFRDDAFKAANWFTGNKEPFSRKQYGGAVGGPILQNRTHYFVSAEQQADDETTVPNTGASYLDTPTAATNDVTLGFVKLDHQLAEAHRLFASYAATYSETLNQSIGGSATVEYGTNRIRKTHAATIGETWVVSDRAVNDFRFLYRNHDTQANANVDKPALLFPSAMLGTRTNYPQNRAEERLQFRNDFSYFLPNWKGTHSFKMGVDFSRVDYVVYFANFTRGAFTYTQDPANFLDPATYPAAVRYQQGLGRFDTADNTHTFNVYAQDDWQPMPRLTLNLGLRYEVEFGSANNDFSTSRSNLVEPKKTDVNNIGPRLGATYDVTGSGTTILRGGFGVFYDQFLLNMAFNEKLFNGETFVIADIRPTAGQPISFTDPLGGRGFEDFLSTASATAVQTIDPNLVVPYTYQSSVGFQQRVGSAAALSVDYVRIDGRHDILRRDINLDPNCPNLNAGCRRPDPRYTSNTRSESVGSSVYNGLHTSFTYRKAQVSMQTSYTLSKAMNYGDDPAFGSTRSNQFDLGPDWGPAANDRRHTIVVNGSVDMPWDTQISGILNGGSGFVILGTRVSEDLNGDGVFTDRPAGVARNSYRSDPTLKVDVRFTKEVRFGRFNMQGIAEVFNVFNRQNYDPTAYGNRIGTATFLQPGSSTTTYFQPRELQLAFRVNF
jgi:hypothetical protein